MSAKKAFIRIFRRANRFLKKALLNLAEAVYPNGLVCLDCHDELTDDSHRYMSICLECFEKLPFRTAKVCDVCGRYINPSEGALCKDCIKEDKYYSKLYALFDYDGLAKKMIVNYKIYSKTYLYEYIAKFLVDFYKAADFIPDYVCYVPMTEKAKRRRGFDHLKKVVEYFSERTGLKLFYPLIRVKDSFKTKRHTKRERAKNIEDAFELKDDMNIEGKTILLLDDVVTTGSTVNECARILKSKGKVKEVIVMSLTRT